MSTKSRPQLNDSKGNKLFNEVRAFTSGTVFIKPMFIVNYSGGNGLVEVDGLLVKEVTSEYELVSVKNTTVSLTQDMNGIVGRVDTVEKNTYTKTQVDSIIDGIDIGGRNYVLGTANKRTITGTNIANQTVNIGNFSIPEDLYNKTITTRIKCKITSSSVSGTLKLQTAAGSYYTLTDALTLKTGVSIVEKTVKMGPNPFTYVSARFDNFVGTVELYELKVEVSSKPTD
ncbi:hypothetical protein [Paraclostridium dentum]|uniref:hypothetical protein n=1 Tax=Paraclostridium dentum TaxID=2662455 RepID=UPI003F35FE4C